MSADRLAEIKARAEAATPGPWSAADERELWREEDPSIEPSWCVSQRRPGFEEMSPTEGYVGDVFTTAGCFESTEADARFVAAAREDVPWLVSLVESLTAERDALAEGRCMANTTLRDDEHRLALCVLPKGHRAAHDDLLGTSWTDGTHYGQSEVERLRETVARVEAIHSPVEVEPSETICAGCSTKRGSGASLRYFPYVDWPCETVAALAGPTGQEAE